MLTLFLLQSYLKSDIESTTNSKYCLIRRLNCY